MDAIKKCKLCGEDNQVEFYTSRNTRCKSCVRRKQIEFNNANPSYLKAKNQRRRARLLSLPNDLKKGQWEGVVERFGGKCCLTDSTDICMEHIIPLHNGFMGTTITNVVPMDKTLNLAKGGKNFVDWICEPEVEKLIDLKKADAVIEYLAEVNELSVGDYLQFTYFCEKNKRSVEETKADPRSGVDIWKESQK